MLDFYGKLFKKQEKQVELAEVGYAIKLRNLPAALAGASMEESERLIEDVRFAKEALEDMKKERDSTKARYIAERNKPENAVKVLKEIEFEGDL
nr:MAG TPA: hypothetical protein [Caudoviricetes sp.]